jgi:hypothetical protein
MKKQPYPRRPRSYVVRIYRQSSKSLVGQIQDVQKGGIRSFKAAGELWLAIGGTALSTRPRTRARRLKT